MFDFFNAHRKAIIAAIAAALVIFVDEQTAQDVAAAVGTLLVFIIPNDEGAVSRIYGPTQ